MQIEDRREFCNFWVIGVNYRKTDATIRGEFAIGNDQYDKLLTQAAKRGLKELFVLSTCNRTEIYGVAEHASELVELICDHTSGNIETFQKLAYIKNGRCAVNHLYEVSTGLDSQVLGDYEIVGQMKAAAKFAKERGFIGPYTERLINSCLQASKAVKSSTKLSSGTVSVSFSAIQYIRKQVKHPHRILLIGTGKIGRSTCKNIVDYLGTTEVTLVNRTEAKAEALAAEYGLRCAPVEELHQLINSSSIIITATNSREYLITASHLGEGHKKTLIDLSIPYNIDPAVKVLPGVSLLNVDDLSMIKDETLKMRLAEVPKAKGIIKDHLEEFAEWQRMRHHVPVLVALKQKLNQMENCLLAQNNLNEILAAYDYQQRVQDILNATAVNLRKHNTRGCQYIQAINDFIA